MAASTMAAAPIAAKPQPWRKTPTRMRNSPAKFVDPGTASVNMPAAMSTVARIGRPFAAPPSRTNSPVPYSFSTKPASRNITADTSPWLTEWSTAPSSPVVEAEKIPRVIRLI
jgi:hypothetical protein